MFKMISFATTKLPQIIFWIAVASEVADLVKERLKDLPKGTPKMAAAK